MRPLGPEVDDMPRRRPERVLLRGHYVTLEPAEAGHHAELWAAQCEAGPELLADSFAYLPYGPAKSADKFAHWFAGFAAREDNTVWVIRPANGTASGWLTLLDIQPQFATIELGSIWLAPQIQRSRAATEAFALVMNYALSELSYRRLTWKCNALNAPSRRAALRLGFTFEGILRNHMIVKGRSRDSAYFSLLDEEWPACHAALEAWLQPENFDHEGRQRATLEALREAGKP